ncbi:MAG: hypothetical protein A2563_01670 [Candidatus Magasanikbacteria bacterium RIFOXYD1_FULL_40_23]|uniref:ABC transporter ATP-binding protein n=1 Tax=Candidatus Magasanikbacteria bacterium RIFOXYD1_FULL_40_23 TaxID=1798705 RepID=A0A1F6PAT4_9BACT|nr:MAG: hypothetical protein A2563_01670 [Candidatus Magasanikbacteria bacterium RIFOXYD1_FULL_40_23]
MQENTKKTLGIFWKYTMKYWPAFFITVFFLVVGAIITVITPIYLKKIVDLMSAGSLARNETYKNLMSILSVIVILYIVEWAAWRISTYFAGRVELRVMADLSNACFKYLHKLSFNFFNNNFVGSLVKRVNWFTRAYEGIIEVFFWDLFLVVVRIGLMLVVIFQRNTILGWSLVGWIVCFLVFNQMFVKFKLKYNLKRNDAETKATGILADTITNHLNVKLFTGYKHEEKRYGDITNEVKKWRTITWNLDTLFEAVQSFFMFALDVGILYLAITFWKKGTLTVGDLVLLQTYLFGMISMLWSFGRNIRRIYNHLADAEEMTVMFNTPPEIVDLSKAVALKPGAGKIEFKNVSFNYNQTKEILKKLNLVISPQEKIALVGPSGAGKSTITKLLLRLYELSAGKILVDNQDISKVKMESLWQNVSLVPQDPILFHRTLLENIRYGKPDATEAEVFEAAKLAHCDEFIKDFPEGYATFVGERGVKLSGGERQRVAIARAILHNAPILILDEATSSLDSESEQLIQKALDVLIKGKTVIVIAHRLSTIMKMDRILVVKDGKITETGSHKELLQKEDGIYKKLWEVQAGGFIA